MTFSVDSKIYKLLGEGSLQRKRFDVLVEIYVKTEGYGLNLL